MTLFGIDEFVDRAEEVEGAELRLKARSLVPPTLKALRRLRKLGLLADDVVLALLGQAPIDPLGIYGAMKEMGAWAFQPIDCTMVQILAKSGARPIALMRLDLLSDDLEFVVLREGKLVLRERISGDQMVERMREPGMNEERFRAWLTEKMNAAVAEGRANVERRPGA